MTKSEQLKIIADQAANIETHGNALEKLTNSLYQIENDEEFALGLLFKMMAEEVFKNSMEDDNVDNKKLKIVLNSMKKTVKSFKDDTLFKDSLIKFGRSFRSLLVSKIIPDVITLGGLEVLVNDPDYPLVIKDIGKTYNYIPDLDLNLLNPSSAKKIIKKFHNILEPQVEKYNIKRICAIEKRKGPVGALMILPELISRLELEGFIYKANALDYTGRIKGNTPMANENVSIIYDLANSGSGLCEVIDYLENTYHCKVPFCVVLFDYENIELKKKFEKRKTRLFSCYKKSRIDKQLRKREERLKIVEEKLDRIEKEVENLPSPNREKEIYTRVLRII